MGLGIDAGKSGVKVGVLYKCILQVTERSKTIQFEYILGISRAGGERSIPFDRLEPGYLPALFWLHWLP